MNSSRDQAKADKVWEDCGHDASPPMPDAQEPLYLMLKEKRRREGIARRADSAVLAQSLAIWKRYQIYVENERHKLATINDIEENPIPELDSPIDAVRYVVNGTPLKKREIEQVIKQTFPNVALQKHSVSACLKFMVKKKEAVTIGKRGKYLFTKLHVLLVLVSVLCGCSTAIQRTPEPVPAAIMPRRMPSPPPPAELAPVVPTTTTINLAWDSVPGALTYRVDYGLDGSAMTNSLMTQATDCTIRELELGRVYHYNVRACNGRMYGPVSNVIIK